MTLLVAHEEGTLTLDEIEPHTGATVADVLAHASGVGFDTHDLVHRPRHKRLYSSVGYDLLADLLAARAHMPFVEYLRLAVARPLGMTTFSLGRSRRPRLGRRPPPTDSRLAYADPHSRLHPSAGLHHPSART